MSLGIDYDLVLLPPRHPADADYPFSQPGGVRPLLLPWSVEERLDFRPHPPRRRRQRRNNRNRVSGGAPRLVDTPRLANDADSLARDLTSVSLMPRASAPTRFAPALTLLAPPSVAWGRRLHRLPLPWVESRQLHWLPHLWVGC
jgi:hypothetical protein